MVNLKQSSPHLRRRFEQSFMAVVGLLLIASGLAHFVVFFVDGSEWSGTVSWRKPTLFGLSTGATLLSLAWLIGITERRRGDLVLLSAFSLAMFVEVALITGQQWRGVASHFNSSTPFDANILRLIEGLIVFATIVIAELTRRSFQRLEVARDMQVAIRGGMSLLLFACILGFVMVAYGNYRIDRGLDPNIFGKAGVMKFPHGMPIHAIQFLPIVVWAMRLAGVSESRRLVGVWSALASMVAFTTFSLLQTFTGRARFEHWWVSSIVLAVSLMLLAPPMWSIMSHRRILNSKP